jgi:galactofuranose transport system substrate-binding protein
MNSLKQRRRGVVALMLAVVLAALALGGCRKKEGGAGGGAGGGKMRVGFSQTETDGPWRIAETKSMQDEAAKRGYELVFTNARGDLGTQVSNLEDLIAQRVDAIFLAPRQEEGFEAALQSAREAGIPVILIDRQVKGTPGQDFVTFIGSDFVDEGRRAGQWLAKQTGGKAGIIELKGSTGASPAIDRHDGFMDAIKSFPDMKILDGQDADFSRAKAQQIMDTLIQAHGKSITAVYAHNDEMALGAVQSLKSAGMNPGRDVIVLSVDGEKAALEAIAAGDMNATVECNPRFGPIAFDTLEKFKRGEKLPPKIINQDRFFDKSNAAQFVGEAF